MSSTDLFVKKVVNDSLDYHQRCGAPPVGIDVDNQKVHFISSPAEAEKILRRKQREIDFYKRQSRRYRGRMRSLAGGATLAVLAWVLLEESNRSGASLFAGRAPCVCDENTMFVIQAVNPGDNSNKNWARKMAARILPGLLVIALFYVVIASMNTDSIDNTLFLPPEDEREDDETDTDDDESESEHELY